MSGTARTGLEWQSKTVKIMSGNFPNHAERHVLKWLELHRDDLTENWELAMERKPLKNIDLLE